MFTETSGREAGPHHQPTINPRRTAGIKEKQQKTTEHGKQQQPIQNTGNHKHVGSTPERTPKRTGDRSGSTPKPRRRPYRKRTEDISDTPGTPPARRCATIERKESGMTSRQGRQAIAGDGRNGRGRRAGGCRPLRSRSQQRKERRPLRPRHQAPPTTCRRHTATTPTRAPAKTRPGSP